MQRLRLYIVLWLGMTSAGCLGARLAKIENLDLPLPGPHAGAGWRAEVVALIEHYERAPVLAAEDERLDPLYGGLSTLSYFGADAKPRVADQRIPEGPRARGQSLEAACAGVENPAAEQVLATSGRPAFTPLWIPLARAGQLPTETWRCDEGGAVAAADSFCVFGRLALQPTAGRPLILVVHGMFDSGAQEYLQRTAAGLYERGYSVLLPDMRDHGDTLRATPEIATTLGTLEGPDLLALVAAVRRACGDRVGRAGVVGVSAGGLDAIRAFTLDRAGSLDAGVIALSPLLDIPAVIEDLTDTGSCAITRSIELGWLDDLTIAAATGAAFFGGAAMVRAWHAEPLDEATLWTGGIGFGLGLLGAVAVDAWFDGGSEPCVSEHAIANLIEDALSVRWRTLQRRDLGQTMSPAGYRTEPHAIRIDVYLRERAQFLAGRVGAGVGRFEPEGLARDLRSALHSGRSDARLLVLGAADDPLTRVAALREFSDRTAELRQVYAHALRRGGHGAMWIVQPTVTQEIVGRFFGP
jgi:pimeloyl-ACP methyl ester carboxylesterase